MWFLIAMYTFEIRLKVDLYTGILYDIGPTGICRYMLYMIYNTYSSVK